MSVGCLNEISEYGNNLKEFLKDFLEQHLKKIYDLIRNDFYLSHFLFSSQLVNVKIMKLCEVSSLQGRQTFLTRITSK